MLGYLILSSDHHERWAEHLILRFRAEKPKLLQVERLCPLKAQGRENPLPHSQIPLGPNGKVKQNSSAAPSSHALQT